jgi:diadenosine tetraphosphatase ApaH/serine/threonine PP2A family protein phosphatase
MSSKVYGILGDIHSNTEALKAVVDDASSQGVTDWICTGDVVGYNARPSDCIHIIRDELQAPTVCGNHDYYVAYEQNLEDFHPAAAAAVLWTRENISSGDMDWLRSLQMSMPVKGMTLVHATLDMPEHWGYIFDDLQAESHFTYQRTPLCFHGHTHVPVVYEKSPFGIVHYDPRGFENGEFKIVPGRQYFINVGSVGQPRDGDPRASYVVFDTASRVVKFRRLAYDVSIAQAQIRAAGLPERCAERLGTGN